jgi:hypothetical protein
MKIDAGHKKLPEYKDTLIIFIIFVVKKIEQRMKIPLGLRQSILALLERDFGKSLSHYPATILIFVLQNKNFC